MILSLSYLHTYNMNIRKKAKLQFFLLNYFADRVEKKIKKQTQRLK